MFCMGCGAETPPNAVRCPVCGRDVARLPGDSSASSRVHPGASAPGAPSPAAAGAAGVSPAPAPSISAGELDTPGLPRDATGRALLITVIAMMADLLAPWINQLGRRMAPADAGAPILLAVIALAVALTPLSRPSLRRRPAAAVLPIVVGGVGLGAAGLVWLALIIFAASVPGASTDGSVSSAASGTAFFPVADVGLYLFLFGAGVLIYTGYQMFLAAARSGVPATAASVAPASTPAAARHGSLLGDGAEALDAADGELPERLAGQGTPAIAAAAPPPAPRPAPLSRAAPNGVALPGMAAWGDAPPPPPVARPSAAGGWRRQGNPRHP